MPELVEESLNLAKRQQRRLLRCWFREVCHKRHVRTHVLTIPLYTLALIFCHPRTAVLALARIEICI